MYYLYSFMSIPIGYILDIQIESDVKANNRRCYPGLFSQRTSSTVTVRDMLMPSATLPNRPTQLDPDPKKDLQPLKTGETFRMQPTDGGEPIW